MDQPDVAKIVGHLVDEERLSGAIDRRVTQVGFAKNRQFIHRQLAKIARITSLLVDAAPAVQSMC